MDKNQLQKLTLLVYDYTDGYFHVAKDIEEYPDAWCHLDWSARGPGKTTSGLAYMLLKDYKFLYLKRTKLDVETVCSGMSSEDYDTDDFNPYSGINNLCDFNILPRIIDKKTAFGGFYDCTVEGEPIGRPHGYILPFASIKSIKGLNFDFCDFIIFDEFIPQLGERISAQEGEMLLSLIRTVQRDRVKRGLPEVKLLLFANAETIATPVTRTLEVMDEIIELTYSNETIRYLKDREIVLHHIKPSEVDILRAEEETGLYKAMKNTTWGKKSYEGVFASNDFTALKKVSLKGYKPLTSYFYEEKRVYIYINSEGKYYLTYSKADKMKEVYNLNIEGEAQAFYYDVVVDLLEAIIDGRLAVEKYTMYDLITNYKKYFKKF